MPTVELAGVTLAYGDADPSLVDVDLEVADGSFFGLLGPSGSGKTSLIRVVAGLEHPGAGAVLIGGQDVTRVKSAKRNLSMVFQDWALFPHLSAGRNMGFPMQVRGDDQADIERKVAEVAGALSLSELLDRRPAELSAGHRHGVATGRALVGQRPLLLMDEPLANLDATRRRQVRLELARLHRDGDLTVIYATNDQDEALGLADTVAVLAGGRVQQVASPQLLYERPRNTFVAGFVGSPAMNMARAAMVEDERGPALWIGSRRLDLDEEALGRNPGLRAWFGREVLVGVRPEHLRYGGLPAAGGEQRLGGVVTDVEFLGSEQLVHFTNDAVAADGTPGAEWVARIGTDARVARREHLALAVDVRRLAFFDPSDGEAIRA